MVIASTATIANVTNEATYGAAAKVNAAVVAATKGKLPCFALNGKRAAFKWFSVGSKASISRGIAAEWLSRYGVDISDVEAAA